MQYTHPFALVSDTPVPEGMIRLPSGGDVPDDAFGRLWQLYEESYELHNDDLLVTITGREPFRLGLFEFAQMNPPSQRAFIAEDIVVLPGGVIENPREGGSGTAAWCGGHALDGRVIVRFNLDGRAATFEYRDPMAIHLGNDELANGEKTS